MGALPTDWRSQEQRAREGDLARAARRGNQRAWASLYELLAPALYRRVLMPRLGNPVAAEDALAETFRVAIERIDTFEDQGHGIYPWLCRIAHNRAMDLHRARLSANRKLRDLTLALESDQVPIADADDLYEARLEEGELAMRLHAALDELNPRYREAIRLRYVEERSRDECATALELKVGTFDVLVLRALRALAKCFGKQEGQSDE